MPLSRREIVQLASTIAERRSALLVQELRAEPAAPRCIDCQQRHEKTYRA